MDTAVEVGKPLRHPAWSWGNYAYNSLEDMNLTAVTRAMEVSEGAGCRHCGNRGASRTLHRDVQGMSLR